MVIFIMGISAVPASAQTAGQPSEGKVSSSAFFIGPLAEALGYSREGSAFGGGLAVGAGSGVSIGARLLYLIDTESVNTLELTVFMRFYLLGPEAASGPFVQVTAGTAIFARESIVSVPAQTGVISAGLAAGWRFFLGNRWYVEPAVRAGYPYIFGAGVSAGFRL